MTIEGVRVMREGEMAPRLTLGGRWSEAERRARDYEKENIQLRQEIERLNSQVDSMIKDSVKVKSEAVAHEAKRRADHVMEKSRRAQENMMRQNLSQQSERICMSNEDLSHKSLALAFARKSISKQKIECNSLRSKLALAERKVSINDSENRKLIEIKFKQETKINKLEKALELERRAKDILLHAKQQKEKHVVLLLKERDRLRTQVRASINATTDPSAPTAVTPRTSSTSKEKGTPSYSTKRDTPYSAFSTTSF
uniref:Uncharacterized protein n=1 Tax=Aureoumbra lagunensis TaxID=44058 RepID=A0A7S3JZU6_9STRA|mmetsp:Transcript_14236/g.19046  ORF Transcript_14236/g.19046 Transcript_14236/m.19046 type:complete len:255 (+) Transcript_14236:52-816(+)